MRLRDHVLGGGAAALALAPALGVDSLWFLAGAVVIDADHYLDYLLHNGFSDYGLRRFFDYNHHLFIRTRRPDFLALSLLHTVEFLLAGYVLAQWAHWPALRVLLAGMSFRVLLDFAHLMRHGILTKRAVSLLEYWLRRRQLARLGFQPERVYAEALQASQLARLPIL